MKKILCFALMITMLFSLCGCTSEIEDALSAISSLSDKLNTTESDAATATGTSADERPSETATSSVKKQPTSTMTLPSKTKTPRTTESTTTRTVPTQRTTYVAQEFEPITDDGFAEGNGTRSNPYLITTADELVYFSDQVNAGRLADGVCVALGADIDMAGVAFEPIGNDDHWFSASFDGRGFTVSNLTPALIFKDHGQNGNYHCGFFGFVENAEIKNLRLENVNITYSYESNYFTEVGLLAACVYPTRTCTITDCVVNGTIRVDTDILLAGGVVGDIYVTNNAKLECARIQSDTALQVRADSLSAGAFSGNVLGRGEEIFNDLCLQSEILHSSAYQSYVGAFGGAVNSNGTMSVSNCFIKINTHKSVADQVHPLIGGTIDSYKPSGTFTFTNVFGFADGCTLLYEIPSDNPVVEENCAVTDTLPSDCGFDTDVWDITDPAAPFIKFK